MTQLLSKAKTLIVGAAATLTLGGALIASAVPAQAGGFGYGHSGFYGYPATVVVKKRFVHPGFYHHGYYGHPRFVVKKRFVHPGYGFYGHPARVVVKQRFVHPGYGFHGHRVGFYGRPFYRGF